VTTTPPLTLKTTWKREVAIAAGMLAVGLFVLPLAIYAVGRQLIGEYSTDSGALALAEHVWTDFLSLRPTAWILVLCPYVTIQLGRYVRRVWRPKEL